MRSSLAAGTASGCVLWLLAFGVLLMCLCPVAGFAGGFMTTLGADFAASVVAPFLCPDDSRPEILTYETTIQDSSGVDQPATGYHMQCVDEAGQVVRPPSADYGFYFIGLLMLLSLVLAAGLAFIFAAPLGGLVARLARRK
jgi:hypothetical protein